VSKMMNESVFSYKNIADVRAIADLQKRVEVLHPVPKGRWGLGCRVFLSKPSAANPQNQELFLVNFEENPSQCYLLMRVGDKTTVLEAESEMQSLVDKVKLYAHRQTIEVQGESYQIGDFIVKFGAVLVAANTKGYIVDVEYAPCKVPKMCGDTSRIR